MTIHVTWRCSWCHHANVRLNAGLDHCDSCGAQTMTQFEGDDILSIRHTFRPQYKGGSACPQVDGKANLNRFGTIGSTSATSITYDARGNPFSPCATSN
jgi:hypothetical protein